MTTQTKPQIVAESPIPSAPAKGIGDENAQPPADLAVAPAQQPEPPAPANGLAPAEPKLPHVPIVNGICKPETVEGIFRIAQVFWKSGMVPQGVERQEQVIVALMAGMEIGLSPTQSIQKIMVVGNRPTVWGDAALALCHASGKMESIEETLEGDGDAMVAVCRIKRKGSATTVERRFSVEDAKTAKLWQKKSPRGYDTPWITSPKRMLAMRARGFAIRDALPDVLKGLGIEEEVSDYITIRDPAAKQAAVVDAAADIAALPQSDPTPTNGTRAAAPGLDSSSTGGSSASSPGAAPSPASNGAKNGRGKAVA